MSWLSELVEHPSLPNLGKLFSNPLYDVAGAAGIAAPFLLPELGLGGAAAGAAGAADAGADTGILTGGAALGVPDSALGAAGGAADAGGILTGGAALGVPQSALGFASDAGTAGGAASSAIDAAAGGGAGVGAPPVASAATPAGIAPGAAPAGGAAPDLTSVSGVAGNPNWAAPGSVGPFPSNAAGAAAPASGQSALGWLTSPISGNAGGISPLNAAGTAVAAGGLGYNLFNEYETNKALPSLAATTQAMQAQAAELTGSSSQLMNYLTTGTLPAGLKTSIDQATASAKAQLISSYAAKGMDTNPQTNTTLAQELSSIENNSVAAAAQLETGLYNSGLQAANLQSSILKSIAGIDQTQTAQIGSAISNFAAALVKGGGGINIGTSSKPASPVTVNA